MILFLYVEPIPKPVSTVEEFEIVSPSYNDGTPTSVNIVSGDGPGNSVQQAAGEAKELPKVPELLQQSELTLIFMKSCSRKNMCVPFSTTPI